MKILIWIICLFVNAFITTLLNVGGISFGAIPTMVLYGVTIGLALFLCKQWDNHKERKEKEKQQSSIDSHEVEEIEDDDTVSNETMKAFIEVQVQETVHAMEENSKEQFGKENADDFGLVPENPIYTHALEMVEGETEYLSKLRTLSGEKISWERCGSTSVDGVNGVIDIYDTYMPSGELYKTVFFNMYGAEASSKAPNGFIFEEDETKICADMNKEKKIKTRYCSRCGSLIDNTTKKCEGCGKQYFKGIRFNKTTVIIGLSIALCVSIIINVVQFIDMKALDDSLWFWINEADTLEKEMETLSEEKEDLQYQLWEYEEMADFMNGCVVFVEDDGTDWYHTYECSRFTGNAFFAFNKEYAIGLGYTECPYCH